MRCEFCNSALIRVQGRTKRHADCMRCPGCELYNAAVSAQQAAAESLAKVRGKPGYGRAWLNEYGIFADEQIGSAEEAAPFAELTRLALRAGRIESERVVPRTDKATRQVLSRSRAAGKIGVRK
jgi:phage FluMu protein Com